MAELITAFTLLMTLSGDNVLEVSGGVQANGSLVVVALFENQPNNLTLAAFEQQPSGSFQRTNIAQGPIFSLSKKLLLIDGYLYFSAVRNLNLWLFRLVAPGVWEAGAKTASGDIHSSDLHQGVAGAILASANTAVGTALILSAVANPNFAVIAFTILKTIANASTPFLGGNRMTGAVDPSTGRSCHLIRQLTGAVVAACLIANALTLFPLDTALAPSGFDGFVESSAVFSNGIFYFAYYLAGLARLATLDPLTNAVTALTMGALAIGPNQVPGLALAVIGTGLGTSLFAFWPGAAVRILLPLLTVLPIANFPLKAIGPIGVIVTTQLLALAWIFGSGSLVATQMIDAAPAMTAPLLDSGLMLAVVLGLGVLGIFTVSRRRPGRNPGSWAPGTRSSALIAHP